MEAARLDPHQTNSGPRLYARLDVEESPDTWTSEKRTFNKYFYVFINIV
jgi:hypothetical protein